MDNMGFEDILMDGETIFNNMEAFNPDYIPPNYNFRDKQMEALAISLRPALRNGRPINSIIVGQCATGKTTAVKIIFEKLEHSSNKLVCAYVNCQMHTTRFGIFSQIHKKIFGYAPPETGVPFSKVYEKIMKHLSDNNQGLIVALDEVNYLLQNQTLNKVFYDILRANEEFEGLRTGIFPIISDIEFRLALDMNVNSVFSPQEIIFPPYSRGEILDILKDRVKEGFYPNVISNDIIEEITDYTLNSEDLRLGINLLRIVGNNAEADAAKVIEQKHLDEAIASNASINLSKIIKNLNNREKQLLQLIAENPDFNKSGELSKEFKKKTNASYSTFIRAIEKLEALRLIDTKYTGKGVRGNSRDINLKFNPNEVCRCIL
ncbi:MAG: ORC1-type DNA replication protein [Methanobrevibacter sp.]|nr:ORC1-type DNA replication protein [Candidatus Methanoflexus mossambicus]